jgi:hypothetical protein
MVSPELARVFLDSGVGMIELEDGLGRLLAEMASGRAPQVVVARCRPEMLTVSSDGGVG